MSCAPPVGSSAGFRGNCFAPETTAYCSAAQQQASSPPALGRRQATGSRIHMASGVRAAAPPAPAGPSPARSKPGPSRVPRPQPPAKRPATPVPAGLPRTWTPQHLRPQRPGLTLPHGDKKDTRELTRNRMQRNTGSSPCLLPYALKDNCQAHV